MRGIISVIVIAAIAALAAHAAPAKHLKNADCGAPSVSNVHWVWLPNQLGYTNEREISVRFKLDVHGASGGTLYLKQFGLDGYIGNSFNIGNWTTGVDSSESTLVLGRTYRFSISYWNGCVGPEAKYGLLISFSATVGKPGRLQTTSKQTPAACGQKYLVIGSRGSGDAKDGNPATTKYGDAVDGMSAPGTAFAAAFANLFPKGAVTFVHNPYPAVGLAGGWRHLVNLIGGGQPLPKLGAYKDSVREGIQRLEELVPREAMVCPKVKVILVGYSQGAQVVGDAIQHNYWPNVAAVVLFGDPRFNNTDPASHGNFNRQKHGILGKRPVFGGWLSGKVVSYCHRYDPVCQEWMAPWTFRRMGMREHEDYQMADDPETAAVLVRQIVR